MSFRNLTVRFPHDPDGFGRLILAQSGKEFMTIRVAHDPDDWPPFVWFNTGDPDCPAQFVQAYFNDNETWNNVPVPFRVKGEEAHEHPRVLNGRTGH